MKLARQLPSLNALRAFEAAARHGSFSLAGDELHVTHAAISHQIRALEEWFGTRLFKRMPGRVELIDTNGRYSTFLTKMFDQLDAQTRDLKTLVEKNQLSIKVDPQFAAVWLVPRLGNFSERHPEIELDVITEYGDLDPRQDEAQAAIQYVEPGETIKQSEVVVECLSTVSAFPVCSPNLLETIPINKVEDILKHTLLHGEDRDWWRTWFDITGVKTDNPLPGPKFSQSYLTLLAAEAGQGVALLDDVEAADSLAANRLVRVSDIESPAGEYVIVQSTLTPETAVMVTVKAWLRSEMDKFNEQHTDHQALHKTGKQKTVGSPN
jgi:LysR family transcriptional regulator, glycine cleavage system transcriptional activator